MRGHRIIGIVADHAVEQLGEIGDGPRHRAERTVDGRPATVDATAADEAHRWAHAGNAVPDRRAADRGEALLSDRDGAEIRRDAGARAARRAARGALPVVDVA